MGTLDSIFIVVLVLTAIVLCLLMIILLIYNTVDTIIDAIKNRIAYLLENVTKRIK